jgi:hypothetical protein
MYIVRRTQLRIDQATLESDMWACGIGVMRAVEDRSGPIPEEIRASLEGSSYFSTLGSVIS